MKALYRGNRTRFPQDKAIFQLGCELGKGSNSGQETIYDPHS
jgi:hypothetical protein